MALSVSGHHQRGQKLYQKGEFKAAIEAFGEVALSALNYKGPFINHLLGLVPKVYR